MGERWVIDYFEPEKEEERRWGDVMWDRGRLEEWGGLEKEGGRKS